MGKDKDKIEEELESTPEATETVEAAEEEPVTEPAIEEETATDKPEEAVESNPTTTIQGKVPGKSITKGELNFKSKALTTPERHKG